MGALVNPYVFGGAPPPPTNPPILVFADGWHTLSSATAVPDAPQVSTLASGAGRYTSPNSAAARITGSGGRRLPITINGMSGDWMVLGFNARWEVEAQAAIVAINRGGIGTAAQDANTVARFRAETNGDMTVLDSTGATMGVLTGAVSNSYHWFDVKVNAVAVGTISVWMDSTLIINEAAGDFAGASATGNTWGVILNDDHDSGSDNTGSTRIGELLVGHGDATTDRWGEHRAYVLVPDGIDTAGAFAANTGTLATATDELGHNNDTDYAFTSTTNDEFLLTLAALAGATAVTAVKLISLVRMTAGSSAVELALKPAAQATIYRPSFTLTTSYVALALTLQENPNTSAPFTLSEIGDLKAGAKMTGSGDLRVTTSIVQVLMPV